MLRKRITCATVALLVSGALWASPAVAQDGPVEIDFRGGVAVPSAELSDLMKTSASFGMGLDIPIQNAIGVRVQGSGDVYRGKAIESGIGSGRAVADLRLTHFQAGPTFAVTGGDAGSLTVDLYALGGATIASSERDEYSTGEGGAVIVDLSTVWPVATGGAQIGYQVTERLDVFASGELNYIVADEDETVDYTRLGVIGSTSGFSSQASIPVTLGLKLSFPE